MSYSHPLQARKQWGGGGGGEGLLAGQIISKSCSFSPET